MNQKVPRLIQMLDHWETCQLTAYPDNDGTWHVGFGHGNVNNFPPFVDEHTVLKDRAEAMTILLGEIDKIYVPQLDSLLTKNGLVVNDREYSALLDIGYNRGVGRLRDSIAMRFMQHSSLTDYKAWAAMAMVYSTPENFILKSHEAAAAFATVAGPTDVFAPLDIAKDKKTGIERVHLGLTLRRMDDAALFLSKE